jgi:regulator of protease activity HflC (stomatin/prohibitin superfamily)
MDGLYLILIIVIFILAGLKVIYEYERGIVFTLGKYSYELKPGLKIVVPIIQTYQKVDTRVKTIDVPKQDCITKDNVSVSIDAVGYYFVFDIQKAILKVEDFYYAVDQLSQTTLRDVVGEVSLDELLTKRDIISEKIQKIVDKATDEWGIKVQRVELKHIELPKDMQRMMAREAEAEREKRGTIIKSEGEITAAKNLAKAAEIMAKRKGAMTLRTLQTISDIAPESSQKFIFFPTELSEILKKK